MGQAIRGNRDKVVLATKGGILFGENGQGVSNDPEYLRSALEKSLKRLDTEYIDLYYVHRYDEKTPIADIIGLLEQFKTEGLIRAIGVSNFSLDNLQAAAAAGSVDAIQSRYNLLQREIESDILPWCADHGVTVIPWGPLAYGLLGGRYGRDFKLDADDWRHRSGAFDEDVFTRNMDIVDNLKSAASSYDLQPAELAIQWLLAQPAVGSVIAGAKTTDQVLANVAAAGADVSRIDMAELTATLNT